MCDLDLHGINSMRYRPKSEFTSSKLRSAISNGSAVLADVDHRSAWMRRLKDLIDDMASDLGGHDAISTAEQVIVRRASMLTLQLEIMDRGFALNEGVATAKEIETYQRCANSLRRLLESLGLQRRQKDVTPDLRTYLADKGRQVASQ